MSPAIGTLKVLFFSSEQSFSVKATVNKQINKTVQFPMSDQCLHQLELDNKFQSKN